VKRTEDEYAAQVHYRVERAFHRRAKELARIIQERVSDSQFS